MPSSVWRGHISFGMVSIPVRLFRAARPERVKLREVYTVDTSPAPGPLAPETVRPRRGEPVSVDHPKVMSETPPQAVAPALRAILNESGNRVPDSAVTKGFEIERGQFVTLDREELRALAPKTSTTMELVEFVSLATVDPVYFETSYYVRPEPAGEKSYALLFSSLQETKLVGVAQIAMHRREHIILVRSGKSGLIAHTMYFASEVRADEEYRVDRALVNRKELDLANKLVTALQAEFKPGKFRDRYREQLERVIQAKAAGKEIFPAQPAAAAKPAIDIMQALQQSLAGLKKPPEREAPEPKRTSHRQRRSN